MAFFPAFHAHAPSSSFSPERSLFVVIIRLFLSAIFRRFPQRRTSPQPYRTSPVFYEYRPCPAENRPVVQCTFCRAILWQEIIIFSRIRLVAVVSRPVPRPTTIKTTVSPTFFGQTTAFFPLIFLPPLPVVLRFLRRKVIGARC